MCPRCPCPRNTRREEKLEALNGLIERLIKAEVGPNVEYIEVHGYAENVVPIMDLASARPSVRILFLAESISGQHEQFNARNR